MINILMGEAGVGMKIGLRSIEFVTCFYGSSIHCYQIEILLFFVKTCPYVPLQKHLSKICTVFLKKL